MSSRLVRTVLAILCAIAVAKGAWELLRAAGAIGNGSMDGDVQLYFMMGRSILNGLQPYVDLYESKPPGMFLLAAFSLLTTGDHRMFVWIHIFLLIAAPGLVGWIAYKQKKDVAVGLTSAGIAILTMLYVEQRASGMETEAWGTFFAAFYLILLCIKEQRRGMMLMSARAAMIFLAVFMKEPFLLTVIAAAMLLCRTKREFLRGIVYPLLIAGAFGVMFMTVTGWIGAYVNVHLYNMLFERTHFASPIPAGIRALDLYPLFFNIHQLFPSAPIFGYAVATLWAWSPLLRTEKRDWQDMALTLFTSILGFLLCTKIALILTVQSLASQGMGLQDPSLYPNAMTWMVIGGPILCGLLYFQWKRTLLIHTAVSFAALYITSLAVIVSGMSGNHFAAAACVIIALALLWAQAMARVENIWIVGSVAILTVLALGTYTLQQDQIRYWNESKENTAFTDEERTAYAKFDALLDACGIDRFVGPIKTGIYLQHSIWGPLPVPGNFANLPETHPLQRASKENLDVHNQIVLTGATPDLNAYAGFSTDAPECAKAFLPLPGYTVLFRKEMEN